jgi:biopolymer transport protein ExbD
MTRRQPHCRRVTPFLITIPVVTHTVPVQLPSETNRPYQTKPENLRPRIL